MPRRRFQFRLSTLLLLVTLSAVGVDYYRRRSQLLRFAELHAAEAASRWSFAKSKMTDWWFSVGSPIPTDEQWAEYQERDRQLADHHQQVAARYRRGAWFPWLVEPKEAPPWRFTLDELLENKPPAHPSLFRLFK